MHTNAPSPSRLDGFRASAWLRDRRAFLDLWVAFGVGGPGVMVVLVGLELGRLWITRRSQLADLPALRREGIVGDALSLLPPGLDWAVVLLGSGFLLITVAWRLVRARREILRLHATHRQHDTGWD